MMSLKPINNMITLKNDINNKSLQPFYIFAGNDIGLMNLYISKMGNVVRADNVASIWTKITSRTLFDKADPTIYVVRDDKDFMSKHSVHENMVAKQRSLIRKDTLVLLYTSLDSKTTFAHTMFDYTVMFNHMTENQLLRHVCNKTDMNEEEARYFIAKCKCDYTQIENEIDKINRYVAEQGTSKVNYFDIVDQLVYAVEDFNIFDLIDAINKREEADAIVLLDSMIGHGESGLGLLSLLYTNFHNACKIVGYLGTEGICEKTGLTPYVVGNLSKTLCKAYSPNSILACLRLIQDVESGIKTGKYEETFGVQYAVLSILSMY